jgi:hypothetical protein
MSKLKSLTAAVAVLMLTAGSALACHVGGYVYCASNGQPLAGIRIDVVATDGTDYTRYAVSNDQGRYDIALLCEPHCYRITAATPNGETVVTPASGSYDFCTDASNNYVVEPRNWTIDSPLCPKVEPQGACWLTAGGVKFVTSTKDHNWGGNVYPSCDPAPGKGGQWNDRDNINNLHFQGWNIRVIRCGNISGIQPGSESPVTPYNFIDFEGTGTLKGVAGNKADYGTVYFFAHVEDRNEPGSNGQPDEAEKDRYFLNVFTNPADPVGSSVLLADVDGDPATMDPVTITDGNMQIHVSSCDATPTVALRKAAGDDGASVASRVAWLGVPYPNPGRSLATMRFGLPQSAAVSLRVFDAAGRLVRELESGVLPAGEYASTWDLRSTRGDRVAAGVYFVRMTLGAQVIMRTVTVTP